MPKIKIENEEKEEAQEGEVVESHWDFKKILIGGFFIVTLFLFALIIFFPGKNAGRKAVTLGASTSKSLTPTPPLPDKEDIQNIIDSAKSTLSQITSENLTSSEAAIQKVISDLQSLQAGSGSAVDVFCKFVCKK